MMVASYIYWGEHVLPFMDRNNMILDLIRSEKVIINRKGR